VRIHLARKHALELELFHLGTQPLGVRFDFRRSREIPLGSGKIEKLSRVRQAPRQAVEADDDILEFRALSTEFLGPLGRIPDSGLFEFAGYFLQAFFFVLVIKDTSSRNRCVPRVL
jgi:hypothetical protein